MAEIVKLVRLKDYEGNTLVAKSSAANTHDYIQNKSQGQLNQEILNSITNIQNNFIQKSGDKQLTDENFTEEEKQFIAGLMQQALNGWETKTVFTTMTPTTVNGVSTYTFVDNYYYIANEPITELNIALDFTMSETGAACGCIFTAGDTITGSFPSNIKFKGEDCDTDWVFTPQAGREYELTITKYKTSSDTGWWGYVDRR